MGRPCIVACLDVWLSVLIWFQQVKQTGGGTAMIHSHSRQSDQNPPGSSTLAQLSREQREWSGTIRVCAGHIWHRALSKNDSSIIPKMIHQLSKIINNSWTIMHYPWRWVFRSTKWLNDQSMSGSLSKRNRRSAHGGPGSGSPWQSRSKPWQGPGKLWMILSSVALPSVRYQWYDIGLWAMSIFIHLHPELWWWFWRGFQ